MTAPTLRRLLLLLCVVFTKLAAASPGFPAVLKRELELRNSPPCSVCHQGGVTGVGSPGTPFREALRERGLAPMNEGSVGTALAQLREDGVDSDADGKGDVDELAASSNPNGPGMLAESPFEPKYGCGANAAGAAPLPSLVALLALTLGAWRARRSR